MPGKIPCIVFINHWAKKLGGAEYSLLDVLSSVSAQSHPYLVTSEEGLLTSQAAKRGITCHTIPCSLRPGNDVRGKPFRTLLFSCGGLFSFFQFVRSLSRFIKSMNPEIIHANVPISHMALILIFLSGYRGKCVFHIREIFKKNSVPFFLYQFLFPRNRCHIIAISESVRQHLPAALRKAATVVYNGVNIPVSLPAKRLVNREEMRFLYLGRIVPWKGCHNLIDIFAKIKFLHPGRAWSLSLVGDTTYWSDSYRHFLKTRLHAIGLESNCALLPHSDEPGAVMNAHDVFVNASFIEPFGRSIAEAQAQGLPVVTFDGGGIGEIVEHEKTGLLVPYGDIDGFTNAIIRMMDDREAACMMGKRGHDRMKLFFNRDIQIPKICAEIFNATE